MGGDKPVRVLLACSGVGRVNRGIETFFREAFDGLRVAPGLDLRLIKGQGIASRNEVVSWNLPRTGVLARVLGRLTHRNGYVVEQWSSFFSVAAQIRRFRPHVVFYSDASLGFLLFRLRKWVGVPFKLLFSNGGPVHPPFIRTDCVHQVAPCYHLEALRAGEPAAKHFLVPYGIDVAAPPHALDADRQALLRRRLGLPIERKVILSVGWLRRIHKRMHYVIQEIARLPKPRPFLQLLGSMDDGSREVIELGHSLLGKDGFGVSEVPYAGVADFYRAADCFVLASLTEGFGRVYLEALMHGLSTIAHRNPVTEYVVGNSGILRDLTKPGELALAVTAELSAPADAGERLARWEMVRDRFGWPVLLPSYVTMFVTCAEPQAHHVWSGGKNGRPNDLERGLLQPASRLP
jgi:glycosyltransferase involved in cell wall biosynthesis